MIKTNGEATEGSHAQSLLQNSWVHTRLTLPEPLDAAQWLFRT